MRERGLRYNIATGTATLPVALALLVAAWLPSALRGDGGAVQEWGGLVATVAMALCLTELNNRNSLLRVRSRMVATTFAVLCAAMTFLRPLSWQCLPPACLIAAYYVLFLSYLNYRPQGSVFHAFLFLGIGALVFPQMLLLGILFLYCMLVQLRSFTPRSFFAALIGAALPLLLREAWLLMQGVPSALPAMWAELSAWPDPRDLAALTRALPDEIRLISAALVIFASLVAMIHFWRTKFNDKIRTRMLYYIFMIVEIGLILLMVALPAKFDQLLRLLLVNSSPLIAHHLTLAHGRVADVYFLLLLLAVGALFFVSFTGVSLGIWRIS